MWATAVYTLQGRVAARPASYMAGGCGANVSSSWMLQGAPSADGRSGAFVAVVGKTLTVRALSEGVKT